MIREIQRRVLPQIAADEGRLRAYLEKEEGLPPRQLTALRILKRSIDARQRTVYVNVKVRLYLNELPEKEEFTRTEYREVTGGNSVVIVGAGPAGLFAALKLIEKGIKPIVIERGKEVHARRKDLAKISREQVVDSESNYSFGEGGAGAFSDGKLYTRSKKRGNTDRILSVFCQHGASPDILVDAHPHIGTDKLPRVIENIRLTLLRCGGEVHFQTRMTDLILHEGAVRGIQTADGRTFQGPVILATGHSARDVYELLQAREIPLEAKGLAIGVRLEHPQELIDRIQYHSKEGRGKWLPPAEYSLVTQSSGRGVYSFCMCPGGFVVPAASGPEQVVVNGMSPSTRGSRWANSGMVVEMRPEDLAACAGSGLAFSGRDTPLCMMRFQEALERSCWQQGGGRQTAPAQRMADFVNGRLGAALPDSSYTPGLLASPLHFWMPSFITSRLADGFRQFGKRNHGFLTNEAVLIGVETRTSAPVRIVRDDERLHALSVPGLFPCGEGAGYAGGIVSAAIDGERCAEAVAASF